MDLDTSSFIIHRLDVLEGDGSNLSSNHSMQSVLVGNEVFINGLNEGIIVSYQVAGRVVVQITARLLSGAVARKDDQSMPGK